MKKLCIVLLPGAKMLTDSIPSLSGAAELGRVTARDGKGVDGGKGPVLKVWSSEVNVLPAHCRIECMW
jgi:hypothetical protein